MKYLTIGSCLKNEESYIKDFITYHRYVGVEHFVFLDREFHPLREMLKDYSDVEIIHFPEGPENLHQVAWARLIAHMKGKTKWLACIDADQALVPVKTNDVREILRNYEDFASLLVNWHAFGSSGQETRLPGSVFERFLMRAGVGYRNDMAVQFICQPDRALPVPYCNPHMPVLPPGEISINTDRRITGLEDPPVHDTLWLAHYWTKSKEEWDIKTARGRPDAFGQKVDINLYEEYNRDCNAIREERALELWKKANE